MKHKNEASNTQGLFRGIFLASILFLSPNGVMGFDTDGIYDYRSPDGEGNNPGNAEIGKAETPMIRISNNAYGDGFDLPRGVFVEDEGDGDIELDEQTLPSARAISNAIHDQGEADYPSRRKLNQLFFQFGQFLSHDTGLTEPDGGVATGGATGLSGNESFFIEVSNSDPDFNFPLIPLTRSISVAAGSSPTAVREQINTITTFIDASNVYGSDSTRADLLRSFVGGKLKVQTGPDGDLPPFNTFGLSNANAIHLPEDSLFAAGDVRANEQVGLTAFHTLFLREHNRLCDEIANHSYPSADLSDGSVDEEIYQRARAVVGALLQKITYHEWLPLMVGSHSLGYYDGYKPWIDASISNEFSSAAFRIGHTMLPKGYFPIDEYGNVSSLPLRNAFFNPSYVSQNGISAIIRGQAKGLQQELDCFVVDDVRNFLFGPGFGGLDLASLNIQRGREHGIASFNDVRQAYGLGTLGSFSELFGETNAKSSALNQVYGYGNIGDLDLWTGGLCEPHIPGTNLGETFTRIFVDQFTRLRDGDRFYFENREIYSESFIQMIFNTTLVDIIRRNTTIRDGELNGYVFFVPEFNPHQPDLWIGTKRNPDSHKGDDIYNETGVSQRVRIRKSPRRQANSYLTVENDGAFSGTVQVEVNPLNSRTFRSRFYEYTASGRRNISGALRSARYEKEMQPEDQTGIQAGVKVRNRRSVRRAKADLYFSASSGHDYSARDVAEAKLRFRR